MMNSLTDEQIKAELLEISPLDPKIYPPFRYEDTEKQKIIATLHALRKSIKRKDRLLPILNAYYLGKILDDALTSTEEYKLKKELTLHYITMATNVYLLFENDPQQIMRTKRITVQDIKKLKKPKIRQFKSEVQEELFLIGT